MTETESFDARRKRLWDELVMLHDAWAQYSYLFNESQERIELLNACARWFFGTTQRLLMREVILGVSRLTDPPKTGKHANLVLESLLDDPTIDKYVGLRKDIDKAIKQIKVDAAPIRHHRDKYIAHLDERTAVEATTNPLPGLKKGLIRQIIDDMGRVYNMHGGKTRESHAFFELSALGSAQSLVEILEDSERWAKWKQWNRPKKEEKSD